MHLLKQCFWCLCVCINTMDSYLAYTVFQVADNVSITFIKMQQVSGTNLLLG